MVSFGQRSHQHTVRIPAVPPGDGKQLLLCNVVTQALLLSVQKSHAGWDGGLPAERGKEGGKGEFSALLGCDACVLAAISGERARLGRGSEQEGQRRQPGALSPNPLLQPFSREEIL